MRFKHAIITFAFAFVGGVGALVGVQANTKTKGALAASYTAGFLNTSDWTNVKAYAWKAGSNPEVKNHDWPGVDATDTGKTEGTHKIYSYSIDTSLYDKLIFNKGSSGDGNQTGNLDVPSADNWVYDYENSGWAKPHTWGLCGTLNGAAWANDIQTSSTAPINATSASITVTLKSGDTFKFRADEKWDIKLLGDDIVGQNGDYFTSTGGGDSNAVVKNYKGGTYTFTINWRVENYGTKSYGISVTNYVSDGETPWKMVGNGSLWTGDFVYENGVSMVVNSGNPAEVKVVNVDLTQGDEFKFYDGSTWRGYSNIDAKSPLKNAFQSGEENNIVVKTGYSGTFDFFVNTSNGVIWATSPDYVALDGWARGFVDAEDLCDGEGEEWSTYAGYYAALNASARALFASDKVTANASGTYIEKAAYRYEQGVTVKHQTAFAAAERPLSPSRTTVPIISENHNTIMVVAIISVLSITALGGFFFIRKRKESK